MKKWKFYYALYLALQIILLPINIVVIFILGGVGAFVARDFAGDYVEFTYFVKIRDAIRKMRRDAKNENS